MKAMGSMDAICADLAAEHEALDVVVAALPTEAWELPTPATGWAVRDQIGHLQYFDATATLAATDAAAFVASVSALGSIDDTLSASRAMTSADLLAEWRAGRIRMLDTFRELDAKARLPWYGPPMSAMSFATARLMETWAHGQDVVDTLHVTRAATDRLRHVAHIGVRARPFSYRANGLEPPESDIHVALRAPNGESWVWGDAALPDRVVGDALDFCLVVTQRRHVADTALTVEGPLATEWIAIAQAFAGPPGHGRRPGQFPRS
jgi:uncharacterized protein (TIGR03084 family)